MIFLILFTSLLLFKYIFFEGVEIFKFFFFLILFFLPFSQNSVFFVWYTMVHISYLLRLFHPILSPFFSSALHCPLTALFTFLLLISWLISSAARFSQLLHALIFFFFQYSHLSITSPAAAERCKAFLLLLPVRKKSVFLTVFWEKDSCLKSSDIIP